MKARQNLAAAASAAGLLLFAFGCVSWAKAAVVDAGQLPAVQLERTGADRATDERPEPPAQAVCTQGLHKSWSFVAGTPLNEPPARSASGQVTVATQGGYLHALSWEGAFLWSYSTEGGLLSGVHAVGDGRLVAISSSRQVYSWQGNGQLLWSFRSPVAPARVVVSDPRQLVYFVSGLHLYALTARGSLAWRAELLQPVVSNVVVDAAGSAWLITADDKLHRVRTPYFHDAWALGPGASARPSALVQSPVLVAAFDGGAVIVRDGVLSWIEPKGRVRWQRAGIARATSSVVDGQASVVALDEQGHALWLSAATGELQKSVDLGPLDQRAADLTLAAQSEHLALGDTQGRLWVYNRRGQSAHCTVSFAAVLEPLFDPTHKQVIAAAGDGSVLAVAFDGEW